jgi:hypothetical protein
MASKFKAAIRCYVLRAEAGWKCENHDLYKIEPLTLYAQYEFGRFSADATVRCRVTHPSGVLTVLATSKDNFQKSP